MGATAADASFIHGMFSRPDVAVAGQLSFSERSQMVLLTQ